MVYLLFQITIANFSLQATSANTDNTAPTGPVPRTLATLKFESESHIPSFRPLLPCTARTGVEKFCNPEGEQKLDDLLTLPPFKMRSKIAIHRHVENSRPGPAYGLG